MASKDVSAKTPTMADVTDDVMRGIGATGDAFADAMAVAAQIAGPEIPVVAEEIGDGFTVLPTDKKGTLIGVPMVLLKWEWHLGDNGPFVSVHLVTADGGKFIVNDGSTGIYSQLQEYSRNSGRDGILRAPHGFRESVYATCMGCGKPRKSTDDECAAILRNGSVCGDTDTGRGTGQTYYLDTSA